MDVVPRDDDWPYMHSPITFTARYTPVDDEGDLLHEERVEVEAKATIE